MSGLLDFIADQNSKSDLADWAQATLGQSQPGLAQLAKADPNSFRQLLPSIIQQQMGQQAITQLYNGGSSQPQSAAPAQQSPLAQYGSQGDSSPNVPVPQTLPNPDGSSSTPLAQISQPQAVPVNNGLPDQNRLRALTAMSGGDPSKAIALARTLSTPSGAGAPPEGMQYDPANPGTLMRIPGSVSKGQSEVDAPFAASWETYNNAGGATRTQDSIAKVQGVIDQLKNGDITTGGPIDALSMAHGEPTETGQLLDRKLLAARNTVSSAVLPLAKPLFGSRVTNFDAQSLVNSQGLDPLQSTDANIAKLEQLKNSISAGQQDIENSGKYFTQHGTLAGYQKPSALAQVAPNLAAQTAPVAASPTALAQISQQAPKVYVNPQTGARITKQNGQWVPVQ